MPVRGRSQAKIFGTTVDINIFIININSTVNIQNSLCVVDISIARIWTYSMYQEPDF